MADEFVGRHRTFELMSNVKGQPKTWQSKIIIKVFEFKDGHFSASYDGVIVEGLYGSFEDAEHAAFTGDTSRALVIRGVKQKK